MNHKLAFVTAGLLSLFAIPVGATDAITDDIFLEGETASLDRFLWVNRPLIVFADTPEDPRFKRQIELLEAETEALRDRDVVVLTDTDPDSNSALREKLHPRGFMLVLIGKDGTVKLRKPQPWTLRELGRSIDKMPLRMQEIKDRRGQ